MGAICQAASEGEGALKAMEGPVSHGADMGSITGAGRACHLKINSSQEGFLPAEETLAEMHSPVVGTREVDVRCHLGRTESGGG